MDFFYYFFMVTAQSRISFCVYERKSKSSQINVNALLMAEATCCLTFSHPSSTRSLSATNSMYIFMRSQFMPIRLQGRASVRNSCSIVTASLIMLYTRSCDGLLIRCLNIRQAKSQCNPCKIVRLLEIQYMINGILFNQSSAILQ